MEVAIMAQPSDEELIRRYVAAYNRHDIEGVMACFHDQPLLTDNQGTRHEGREAVRRRYQFEFDACPDGHCGIRTVATHAGGGVIESVFTGTHSSNRQSITAIGTELVECAGGRIKEIRDYHRFVR
jgi:taurine dehydrogenase small subunit